MPHTRVPQMLFESKTPYRCFFNATIFIPKFFFPFIRLPNLRAGSIGEQSLLQYENNTFQGRGRLVYGDVYTLYGFILVIQQKVKKYENIFEMNLTFHCTCEKNTQKEKFPLTSFLKKIIFQPKHCE